MVNVAFLLLFLHITTMIAAVTVSYGPSLAFRMAVRTGQVSSVRGALASAQPLGPWIPILYVAGGVFGLLTAISFGSNLLAPWLVIAYVLWVVAMLTGLAIHAPHARRLGPLVAATPDGPIPPDLGAVLADPRERAASILDYVVIVAILFDMVFKPFS
jgi:hypothetical protein